MNVEDFFKRPVDFYKLLKGLVLFIVFLSVVHFFISKETHFTIEKVPSFAGLFGFLMTIILILGAKYIVRKIVQRGKDYYE